ncbi:hypothetical protein BD830_1168 [Maritimibacter alkaliphilus HTCC2654]|jgi:hypothetical protein|uniref:hypothetical protein n=1 Tax=Maritimibacter alkaliphilus TaxID=404236 RepID=UPI0005943C41|nr:hypothetical protein [Maritimibacter alkaliphilus]TYP78501.1 hypothetical protein BD830_1168 [Maritimibacter alkaliphilus HTCC2654]
MDWKNHFLAQDTPQGTLAIHRLPDGYHLFFDNEDLGCYASLASALEDLSSGKSFRPSNGEPISYRCPEGADDWQLRSYSFR